MSIASFSKKSLRSCCVLHLAEICGKFCHESVVETGKVCCGDEKDERVKRLIFKILNLRPESKEIISVAQHNKFSHHCKIVVDLVEEIAGDNKLAADCC